MNLYKFFLFSCLFFIPALAHALKTDNSQPIVARSDAGFADLSGQDFTINDNVDVTQGSIKIHGNKLTIKKENKQKIILVDGTPATFTQLLENKNKVGKNRTFKASAGHIRYDMAAGTVYLTANVIVQIDNNKISGTMVTYNTASGEYTVKGNSQQRATIIFYPE